METVTVNIRPYGDRVIVKKAPEKSPEGLIVIPDQSAQGTYQRVEVVAINEGRSNLHVGDILFIPKYAGTGIGREGLLVVKEEEILAILNRQ